MKGKEMNEKRNWKLAHKKKTIKKKNQSLLEKCKGNEITLIINKNEMSM